MPTENTDRYSHTRWLREKLKDTRERLGMSALDVDRAVSKALKETRRPNYQRIYRWEGIDGDPGKANPRIDQFATWSRVLGFRLEVNLVPLDQTSETVHLQTKEAARAARILDRLPESKRAALVKMLEEWAQ